MRKIVEQPLRAKFAAWFNSKWAEWDAREGRRTTQYELSDYLKVTRAAIAQYASGRQVPEGTNLVRIANKFGDEVYDLLSVSKPEDELSQLPEPFETRLRKAADEIKMRLEAGEFSSDSEEHVTAAVEVFAKFGLKLQSIEIEDEQSDKPS